MNKLIVGFVPKDSREFAYVVDSKKYKGYSTIEALASYFLQDSVNFRILLLRPESLDESWEEDLKSRLISIGMKEENIVACKFPINGSYEGKRFITDPKIISDFIFLALKENYKEEKEVILDVSRGLNFLVLSAVEAYRRFIVAIKAKNILHRGNILNFKYVYLTPLGEGGGLSEIRLEKIDAPFFFDYFKNYDRLPFDFETEKKEELCMKFNFIKKYITQIVNTCIYTVKRGFVLAFLTIIDWKKVEEFLKEAEDKLNFLALMDLDSELSEWEKTSEGEEIIKRKYTMNYPLGNLWIYINLLKAFLEIYYEYRDKIFIENDLKWIKIETLKDFNERIINGVFKEYGTNVILCNELEKFEFSFKRGEIRESKWGHSDILRNFNAHAGLILDFLEQDPKKGAITYKKEIHNKINSFLREWQKEIETYKS